MTSFADSPSFLQVVDVEEAVVVAAAAEHALQLTVGWAFDDNRDTFLYMAVLLFNINF